MAGVTIGSTNGTTIEAATDQARPSTNSSFPASQKVYVAGPTLDI